ncbi:MAG: PAS domain S-box protein [Labilithrix sp.]|nr:PAS domain S-box protein [Labilithrix sp.]MCW5815184.1 PAS domain S-box protein [Labilithrix sp.]
MSLDAGGRIRQRLESVAAPTDLPLQLLAQAPVPFALWRRDGRFVLANDAFERLFLSSEPPPHAIPDTDVLRRATDGETVVVTTSWTDARERRAAAITVFPLTNAAGEIEHVAATYRDDSALRSLRAGVERSEARFRRLADSGLVGVVTTGAAGTIVDANDTFARMVGYSAAELARGETMLWDLTAAERRHHDRRALEALETRGSASPWETECVRKDGARVPVLVAAAVLDRASGESIAFLLDLTERRRAEKALMLSERRFRRLSDSGLIGIAIADTAGTINDANDAFLSILGYTREDFAAGKVTEQTVNAPDRERTDETARRQLQDFGVAQPWEKELLHKKGHRVPVLCGSVMIDPSTQEVLSFILDLSDRERAEAAARASEARKAAVMEAALDAIVLMNHEGLITEFNPAAERTFGHTRDEVLGRPLSDVIVPPALREHHRAGVERYVATGEASILGRRIEVPAMRKDGSEFPAEVAVVPIRAEGAPIFTGYIRDLTERKRAAKAELLQREKEAAQAANRELEAFSYSVAHDLRAPLRGLGGFSSVLLEDYGDVLDEEARSMLRRIIAAGVRMGQIIDALLALARLSRTELRRETVDLTKIARDVFDHLRTLEPARDVELVAMEGITANGDAGLLRVALENLLGNAWKFTRHQARARIELGATPAADGGGYFVRDNGAGFNMAHATRLFTPFQRLHSPEQYEGTGVGLATVQRVVLRHGGRVWVEAKEGEGATFRFTLEGTAPRGSS